MVPTFDKRLLVVLGKGGVGKSLVASALARMALARGKKVLLIQVNAKDSVSGYLGTEPIGDKIQEMEPNLWTVNIRPESALKEYVLLQVKLELIYRVVFENRAVRYFLRAVPALNDLVVLGKIHYHAMQKDKEDRPLYDIVVLDAPPTGHGLSLLRIPKLLLSVVNTGPVHREALAMREFLEDPDKTAVHLVALPEEMPVSEAVEAAHRLKGDFGLPLGLLFVNKILQNTLHEGDESQVTRLEKLGDTLPAARCAAQAAKRTMVREVSARRHLEELAEKLPLPRLHIPYWLEDDPAVMAQETVAVLEAQWVGLGEG